MNRIAYGVSAVAVAGLVAGGMLGLGVSQPPPYYPGIPCIQGQNCALGSGSTIGGNPIAGDTATSAPVTLFVNAALGSDSNACTSALTGACKTEQGALNKVPKTVRHPVVINVSGGSTYAGATFEDFRFEPQAGGPNANGAYIEITGARTLAFTSPNPNSGSVTSATQLSGNNFATLTPNPAGGWPANTLRGDLLYISSGTGAGQTLSVYGNSGVLITLDGSWVTTPDNTSQYQLLDPCNGGTVNASDITVPVTGASVGFASGNLTPTGDYTAFLITNSQQSLGLPTLARESSASAKGGSIYISNMCMTGTAGEAVTARKSDGVVVRWSKMTALTPASGCYITTDRWNLVVANSYATGATRDYALSCGMGGGGFLGVILDGNAVDSMYLYAGVSGTGGAFSPTGNTNLITNANSAQNVHNGPAISADACNDCSFNADKIETTTGGTGPNGFCVTIGCGVDSNTNCRGTYSTGKISGGFYNGCATGGLLIAGGAWNLRTTALTGTPTAGFGVDVRALGIVDNNAALATIAGPAGAITLNGGQSGFSWAQLATWQSATSSITGARIYNAAPGLTVGKIFDGFTDTSGTPGSATANTTCGRSAIAAAGTAATITNQGATTTSQVQLTQETKDATCTSLYVTTLASGSFTVTCAAAATAATNFSWCVHN